MQPLAIVSAVWVASELAVAFLRHSKSDEKRSDRGSLFLLWLVIGGAIFAASKLRWIARMPHYRIALDVGIAVMIAGIVIRAIAIATLWRYFSVDVTIRSDQQIVQHGIYAYLRHPSYTGSLLAFIGLGTAFGSWRSLPSSPSPGCRTGSPWRSAPSPSTSETRTALTRLTRSG